MDNRLLINTASITGDYLLGDSRIDIEAQSNPCVIKVAYEKEKCPLITAHTKVYLPCLDCICSFKVLDYTMRKKCVNGRTVRKIKWFYRLLYYDIWGQRKYYCGEVEKIWTTYLGVTCILEDWVDYCWQCTKGGMLYIDLCMRQVNG